MIGTIKNRVLVIAGLIVFSLALVTSVTFAKQPDNGSECKPGWGWNDKNHCHSGPPGGPSVHPVK